MKNLIVENQIWRELTHNNIKQKPINVSKENHHHSEIATNKLNFENSDIRGRMMKNKCWNIHEENHKRVEVAINRGSNNVIKKMVRVRASRQILKISRSMSIRGQP